jgi:hypothetical protein
MPRIRGIYVFLLGGKIRRCWCLKFGVGVVGGVFVGLCAEVKAGKNIVPAASPSIRSGD